MFSFNFSVKNTLWILFLALYIVDETQQYHLLDHVQFVNRTRRQATCGSDEFKCGSGGGCIAGYEKCDGISHCKDSSDETPNTCRNEKCPEYSFRCKYGACVAQDAECNGNKDCADNSDENSVKCVSKNTQNSNPGVGTRSCSSNEYTCDSGECIPNFSRCDGVADCKDGSDETLALCQSENCPELAFRCKYGACLSFEVRCNGVKDCVDNSDEEPTMCGYTTEKPIVRPTDASPVRPQQASSDCKLPEIPDWGNYKVNNQTARPGSWVKTGSYLTYSCRNKYKLVPNLDLHFCLNGKWAYELPKCIATCTERISNTVEYTCAYNGIPQNCSERMIEGTIVDMKCTGFHRETSTNTPRRLTCIDGTWDYPPISCEPECGRKEGNSVQTFAINAIDAQINEHPWHVGIYRKENNRGPIKHICGGTILNPKVILSAAHCFSDPTRGDPYPPFEYYVAAGKNYRDYNAAQDEKTVQKQQVQNIILNENYKAFTLRYSHDIALVILEKPLLQNTLIKSICIDTDSKYPFQPNEYGKVVGWGVTELEGRLGDPHLKELNIPILGRDECFTTVPSDFQAYLTPDKICAGYTNGSSVCQGDSGGGLIVQKNGVHFIRGIVSNGPQKGNWCDNRQVGAYTAVSEFSNFISSARYYYYAV